MTDDRQSGDRRDPRLDALWARAQQDVTGRAAHEVKNALNGVAVNLEVVRVRAARAADAEAIARFAESAAAQLELLIRQVDALLGVARPVGGVTDVAAAARHLHALLERTGPEGATLRLDAADGVSAPTSADVAVVRLLVARLLLGLAEQPGNAELALRVLDDGRAELAARGERPPVLDPDCRALAAAAGVTVSAAGPDALILSFPAASAAATV